MTDYRETDAEDYLHTTIKDTEQMKNGSTSQRKFIPKHIIPLEEQVNITDEVEADSNKVEAAEQINITDELSTESALTGEFQADGDFFCGSFYVPEATSKKDGDFASGNGNFNEPDQPAVADFSDIGA